MRFHYFKLTLAPSMHHQITYRSPVTLSWDSIAELLVGATLKAVTERTIEFEVPAGNHYEQLNKVLKVLEPIGWEIVGGQVSELVDEVVSTAVVTALGGFAIGGGATDNLELGIVGAFVGWAAGMYAGSKMRKREQLFLVQPTWPHGFRLIEVPLNAAGEIAEQAG